MLLVSGPAGRVSTATVAGTAVAGAGCMHHRLEVWQLGLQQLQQLLKRREAAGRGGHCKGSERSVPSALDGYHGTCLDVDYYLNTSRCLPACQGACLAGNLGWAAPPLGPSGMHPKHQARATAHLLRIHGWQSCLSREGRRARAPAQHGAAADLWRAALPSAAATHAQTIGLARAGGHVPRMAGPQHQRHSPGAAPPAPVLAEPRLGAASRSHPTVHRPEAGVAARRQQRQACRRRRRRQVVGAARMGDRAC